MTAPDPRWHPRGMTMFDVGRAQQLDHEDIQPKVAHVIGNMLQAVAGGCQTGFCKVSSCGEPRRMQDQLLRKSTPRPLPRESADGGAVTDAMPVLR